MADNLELSATVYRAAAVGAIVLGGVAAIALPGMSNVLAAAMIGGFVGAAIGLFLDRPPGPPTW